MKTGIFFLIMSAIILSTILPMTSFAAAGDTAIESKDKDKYELVTGMDFSYWAGDTENMYGPGITFGFILIPQHLELTFSLGAMTGTTWHIIPVEMVIEVPFHVLDWLSLYLNAGPTIMSKETMWYTKVAWALSAGAGVELLPIDFDWGVYAEFDYNYRFGHHLTREDTENKPHTYGFTTGFNYRF